MSKKEEVLNYIKSKKCIVYCFNETHVTKDILNKELYTEGYNMVRCDSHSRFTGGILIYVNNKAIFEEFINFNFENKIFMLGIRYVFGKNAFNIICVYRSPSATPKLFTDKMKDIFDNLEITGNTLIVGDFNINIKESTTTSKNLLDIMQEMGYKQLVKEATRITPTSETIIDLVFANHKSINVTVQHSASCQIIP